MVINKMASSVDLNEMAHYELSHVDLHCLSMSILCKEAMSIFCKEAMSILCKEGLSQWSLTKWQAV